MEVKRASIVTNVTWLAAGNVVIKPIWFVFLLLTARLLGAAEYGQFMLAISIVSFAYIFLEGGVDILTVRELSDKPDEFRRFFGHTALFKLATGVISGIAAIAAAFILKLSWVLINIVVLASIYNVSNVLLMHFRTVFRAFEVLKYEAISAVLEKTAAIVFCVGILFMHLGVAAYAAGFAVAYLVSSSVTLVILVAKIGVPKLGIQFSYLWHRIIKPALPFALMNIFIVIYFRSGILMLGAITGREVLVGYYSAGYKLVESFTLFPTIIVAPIYAVVTRQREDVETVRKIMLEAFRALLFIGVVISCSIFIFREQITLLLFGEGYREAIGTVGIIALTMIPIAVDFGAGTLVAATGRQGKANWFIFGATLLNIVMNYVLIKVMSTNGAAMTTVITEIVIALSNLFIVHDYVPWRRVLDLFLRTILPMLGIFGLMLTPFKNVSFVIQAATSLAIVGGSYFLLRVVTFRDLQKLLHFTA